MGFRRRVTAAALALALAATLTGCSVIGTIVDNTAITAGLAALDSRLSDIPGVTVDTNTFEPAPDAASFTITLSASATTDEHVHDVLKAVAAAFRAPPFDGQQRSFTLSLDQSQSIYLSYFSMPDAELKSQVDYWKALQSTYGYPLSMGFSETIDADGDPTYARAISTVGPSTVASWDALRDVPDTSTVENSWQFPGISSFGSLPPQRIVDLATSLGTLAPLIDYAAPVDGSNLNVEWYANSAFTDVYLTTESGDAPLTEPETLGLLVGAANVFAAAGVMPGQLTLQGTSGYTVHFGTCDHDGGAAPIESDTALFDVLTAAGVAFPADSGPGFCSHAY